MTRTVGLDFGTTNSALAVIDGGNDPKLATFTSASGPLETFRSVLYFTPEQVDCVGRPQPISGPQAIDLYIDEDDGSGRLVQSMKTWLASRLFTHTVIGRRNSFTLEALIGSIIADIKAEAEAQMGPLGQRVVVGRPVHLTTPADLSRDAFGIERLRLALDQAGFSQVTFVYEPVAAAYHYEQRLTRQEIVLIADFGGGTSDFSLIRVGPGRSSASDRSDDILGTAGLPIAGNAFDSRLVQRLVAPQLGLGTTYRTPFGREMEIPPSIFKLRWHELSMLRSRDTLLSIEEYMKMAVEKEKLAAFEALVRYDLGFALYQAVEALKLTLSQHTQATFRFREDPIDIEVPVRREEFEGWIAPELASIASCVDGLFEAVSLDLSVVDRVFLTGGSSFIPAVRRIFETRFGQDRLRGGEELTSVASGLALASRAMG